MSKSKEHINDEDITVFFDNKINEDVEITIKNPGHTWISMGEIDDKNDNISTVSLTSRLYDGEFKPLSYHALDHTVSFSLSKRVMDKICKNWVEYAEKEETK